MVHKKLKEIAKTRSQHVENIEVIRFLVSSFSNQLLAYETAKTIQSEINKYCPGLQVKTAGSMGYYDLEPVVVIQKPGNSDILYTRVTPETAIQITRDYFIGGNPDQGTAWCYIGDKVVEGVQKADNLPLFRLQKRIALRNCGLMDPTNINHYILDKRGFEGFSRSIAISPADLIQQLKDAGLKDRFGDGGLTADKLAECQKIQSVDKYVICRAFDPIPRSLTAQLLMEGDPYSVLEGALIAAYAVSASKCIFCIHSLSIMANQRLNLAINQMKDIGLFGEDILGSGLNIDIEVREVEVSLASSEETAILSGLEGKPALPYWKSSQFINKGINGKPAVILDPETLANVSAILFNGTELYSDIGTSRNTDTRVITICGDIVHNYTVEVPTEISWQNLIMEIGGGIKEHSRLQAIQFGGPTGVFIKPEILDTSVIFEDIQQIGPPSFNTLEVFSDKTDHIEVMSKIISYLQSQSCGQCVFCREGTHQLSEILHDFYQGRGNLHCLEQLESLAREMSTECICKVGRMAANPILSSLKQFMDIYKSNMDGH